LDLPGNFSRHFEESNVQWQLIRREIIFIVEAARLDMQRSVGRRAATFITETKRPVLAPMGDQGRHLSPRARMVRAAAEKRR